LQRRPAVRLVGVARIARCEGRRGAFIYGSIYIGLYRSISIYLSIYLSICLSVYVCMYLYLHSYIYVDLSLHRVNPYRSGGASPPRPGARLVGVAPIARCEETRGGLRG